jgi:glycerol-3-phosphate O-acyltransferase
VPRIVAGDNLDLPLLGTLFQKCGAFFIRRDAASKMDVSYKAALRGTVGNVLTAGHTLEVQLLYSMY